MRVFVTGASGWIGRPVVARLVEEGHDVVGLARSEAAAAAVEAAGGRAQRGSLEDVELLRDAAASCDGVVHLGYHHDFSQMEAAAALDRAALEAFGQGLEGTGRPLVVAGGVLGLRLDGVGTEDDVPPSLHPRSANAAYARSLAASGVRSVVVRLPPTVHGAGDRGFIATLVDIARERGTAGYVGEGENRWSAVHRDDAASAVCLALASAPAGSAVHAVAEEGIATREIAGAIGRELALPVASVAPGDADAHFGWMALLFSLNAAASSDRTRALLGWAPSGPGLLEDLASGCYAAA